MKTLSLRLDEKQYEHLRMLSFEDRKPSAEPVRDVVDEYLGFLQTTPNIS